MKIKVISLSVLIIFVSLFSDAYAQDKYVTVFAEKFWVDTSAKKILETTVRSTKAITMIEEPSTPSYEEFQVTMAFSYLADHELMTAEVAEVIRKEEGRLTKTKINMFLTKFGEVPTIVMVIWMPLNKKWFIKAHNLGLVCPVKGDRIFHGPNIY